MRTFFVIASALMISAAAHAAPSFQMAANDAPPLAQTVPDTTAAAPAPAAEPAKQADAKPVEAKKPARAKVRESSEHKARRIAAKYGVYW